MVLVFFYLLVMTTRNLWTTSGFLLHGFHLILTYLMVFFIDTIYFIRETCNANINILLYLWSQQTLESNLQVFRIFLYELILPISILWFLFCSYLYKVVSRTCTHKLLLRRRSNQLQLHDFNDTLLLEPYNQEYHLSPKHYQDSSI